MLLKQGFLETVGLLQRLEKQMMGKRVDIPSCDVWTDVFDTEEEAKDFARSYKYA